MTSSNGNIFRVTDPLSPVTGEFPSQRPVTRSFDIFFDLRQNKRLSKQSIRWWFETPSRSLWRQCNDIISITKASDCHNSNGSDWFGIEWQSFLHYGISSVFRFLKQCCPFVRRTLRYIFQWNFNRNSNSFIQQNTLQNVVCKISVILTKQFGHHICRSSSPPRTILWEPIG